MATTTDIRAGATVIARPWLDGRELPAAEGVIVVPTFGGGDEYALVWFPARGGLIDAQVGRAYQPILHVKLEVTGTVSDWTTQTLHRATRALQVSDLGHEVYPLLQAVLKAGR